MVKPKVIKYCKKLFYYFGSYIKLLDRRFKLKFNFLFKVLNLVLYLIFLKKIFQFKFWGLI